MKKTEKEVVHSNIRHLLLIPTLICGLIFLILIAIDTGKRSDTGEVSDQEQAVADESMSNTHITTPHDTLDDPYYAIVSKQEVADLMQYDDDPWMLVSDEDVQINVTLPTYNPDDTRSKSAQLRFTEADAMVQMLTTSINDFMVENRQTEEYNVKQGSIYNLINYYSLVYSDKEIVESGHAVKWKFIIGRFTETAEDCYTFMIYRLDMYSK